MKLAVKIIKWTFAAICLLIFLTAVSIPIVNNCIADNVEKELRSLPLPESTELVDSISAAGKLSGNGNGMQYLGAILVESDLSIEELTEYYAQYKIDGRDIYVNVQNGERVELSEHRDLLFDIDSAHGDCFIVYSWGKSDYVLSELDLRGSY